MASIRSVAVIGTGPAGAIAIDALKKEKAFDSIRVFERREGPGGCWLEDTTAEAAPRPDLETLAGRQYADKPVVPPSTLPSVQPAVKQHRFIESSIYPYLETNIAADVISYSQEPIPDVRSELGISRNGVDTPFRPYKTIKIWVADMVERDGYSELVSYNTTVELAEKNEESGKWTLYLRKSLEGTGQDYWWTETFDAVVVATGHYMVPWIPSIPGLQEFSDASSGAVIHSKAYRDKELYRNKRVVVVGASVSGADLAHDLAEVAAAPLTAVVRGRYHCFFGDHAFQHPNIVRKPSISRVETVNGQATLYFEDGTSASGVDHIIFATGYTWSLPFLPQVPTRNNRVPNLYQHIFWQKDPTLCFVGAVQGGFTFKIFEWQAVTAARFLAGRVSLPPVAEQIRWEEERIAKIGDGPAFHAIYFDRKEDFEEHFEELRLLAGEPSVGADGEEVGRRLPKFRSEWLDAFYDGHQRRIEMWQRVNEAARRRLAENRDAKIPVVQVHRISASAAMSTGA